MIIDQIDKNILELGKQADEDLKEVYAELDRISMVTSDRILSAFIENRVSYTDFADINGYGNYDTGREKLESFSATVLGCEDSLVRPQIMSGTNALYLAFSALLKHGDTMISISGAPYDSLQEMIGVEHHFTVHQYHKINAKYFFSVIIYQLIIFRVFIFTFCLVSATIERERY